MTLHALASRTRLVSGLALVCLMLSGCARVPEAPVSTPVPQGGAGESESMVPALTREGASGRASAVGTLVYRRDQGGFFALADLVPGSEPTTTARLVVVLVQSDGDRRAPDLAPLVGSFCAFSGSLRDETSMTALPELAFESYRILSSPTEP